MKPKLPLSNLNTFTSAAELSSFQAAAEALHVTPSAVSHQIRNLEGLLGYELFDRLDKKVRLTGKGERLYSDLKPAFREIHKATEKALHHCDRKSLILSVAPAFATRWLLPRLDKFYAEYPEINLSLTATSDMVDFYRDDVDGAIRLGNGDWPGAESIKLFDMQLVAVCRPELVQSMDVNPTAQDVARLPLVINSSIPGAWEAWFESAGVLMDVPVRGLSVQNASQSLEAIQNGQQVCLVDRPFVEKELLSGQLVQVVGHRHHGNRAYYLAMSDDAVSRNSLQIFREWLSCQIRDSSFLNE